MLAVKGNQPWLAEDVAEFFAEARTHASVDLEYHMHRMVDTDHGRLDIQQIAATDDPKARAYVDPQQRCAGLRSVVMVEAERRCGAAISHETRFYISSLTADAQVLGVAIHRHWVLDVAFDEDRCRVPTGHVTENFAILRRCALSLLRREPSARIGIKAQRLKARWDDAYLAHILQAQNLIALQRTNIRQPASADRDTMRGGA